MDKETAREMARKILSKWYDQESIGDGLMEEFDQPMIPPILRSGGEGSTLEMLVKGDCCRFRRWDLLFLRKCCDSGIMADTFLINVWKA